jgi:acetolactate synthase-1/2/3 large subunit
LKSTTSTAAMTTAQAAVETLIKHGIDTVYALPGLHNDHLFDAFHGAQGRLRVIHPRHEQACGYMALGAALATGKPQVCAVVPGPGLLNASAALLTAYGMNAPVLCLAGQIAQADIDRGHGHLHEVHDQLGLARHFAKHVARIRAPHEAPELIAQALRAACSGRQRPALLECAIDTWGRTGAVPPAGAPLAVPSIPVDEDAVEAAAKVLGAAKRPLIVVGGGAQGASAEVTRLAELLEAPVVAFRRGQGVLSARHRLHVNLPIAHRLWATADAVLGVGTRLFWQHRQWGVDDGVKVVRLDIDPDEHERFRRPAVALVGDAAEYGRALLARLARHNRKRASRDEELAGHRAWLAERYARFEPQIGFLKAMRNALPDEGVFVDEVTQLGFAARLAFPVYAPRTFLSPGYQDNLGWGLGTALGAKAALGDTPVLAISGDGGFMYQLGELATAVQHGLAVVVVVFDNGMLGNVRLIQEQSYGNRIIATDLRNPDFARLAETFGMAAYTARTASELETAITRAFGLGKPALVHVPCAAMPSPWDMILMPRIRG